MTSAADIVAAAGVVLAALPTPRVPSLTYVAHATGQAFQTAPLAKREAFDIQATEQRFTSTFGMPGTREGVFRMLVRVGSPPFAVEQTREQNRARDVVRIADALERQGWFPAGTMAVFFDTAQVDKVDPNWWITTLAFNVTYLEAFPA